MYPNSDLIATHEIIKAMETSLGFSMTVFNDQPTVTLLVDHEGKVLDANRKAEEFFKIGRAVLLGQPIQKMFPTDAQNTLADHFTNKNDNVCSFPMDDGDIHYYWQVLKIKNEHLSNDIYIVKGTDTTDLHQAYQKMDVLKREREIFDQEMQKAQIIQNTLLPRTSVPEPLEMSSVYLPASQASGDWFGFHHDQKQNILNIYMGDVTGHGIASSLLTGAIFGAMYSTERICDLGFDGRPLTAQNRLKILAKTANETIFQTASDLAMSMFLMSIDLNTGKTYTLNAGHRLPFVYCKKEDKVSLFTGGGEVLGVSIDPQHEVIERQLNDGDLVFLYTDGIVENEGEGKKRVRTKQIKALIENHHDDVNELKKITVDLLEKTWKSLRAEDDVAMMFLKYREGRS
ncbi:MAG: SpoIIE family protein phosphatase [Oligoflexus sp.]